MTPLRQAPSIEAQSADAQRALAELKAEKNEVRAEVNEARAHLAELNLEVEAAESRLENSDSAQLLEANQNLVLSTLRAQEHADVCADSLKNVSQAARHDTLTELPNRELLLDRFTHAIAMARRKGEHLALAVRRPEPLQDHQRHAGSCDRRSGAATGCALPLFGGSRSRYRQPAWRR
jgi:uncharacterized membrane protein YccC